MTEQEERLVELLWNKDPGVRIQGEELLKSLDDEDRAGLYFLEPYFRRKKLFEWMERVLETDDYGDWDAIPKVLPEDIAYCNIHINGEDYRDPLWDDDRWHVRAMKLPAWDCRPYWRFDFQLIGGSRTLSIEMHEGSKGYLYPRFKSFYP
jgi:hypothetical protein